MNSSNPQEFEPSLGERVTRLEVQVASMHAELKGMIETAVAELKGMIAALSARIDAQNARLDGMNQRLDDQARRMDEHSRRMDSLEAHLRKMNTTIIITGVSVALTVIFGVGAINSSLVSGMTSAFQAGDGSARWRSSVEQNVGTLQKDVGTLQKDVGTLQKNVGTLQKDVGELRQNFAEMDARQRRDSTAIQQQATELREIRKLLERREKAPERGKH